MKIFFPEDKDKLRLIKAGEVVEFYGTIYTARDAAHQRLQEMLDNKNELPVDFSSSFIYYAGPTPTKPGKVIGSIGPTTSSRMDSYAKMMKELNVIVLAMKFVLPFIKIIIFFILLLLEDVEHYFLKQL